jgi:hypothetical protein
MTEPREEKVKKAKKKKTEELSTLERLHQGYKSEEQYERLATARSLTEAVEELGLMPSKNHILPIMDELAHDINSEVRQMLVDQILPISKVFQRFSLKGQAVNTELVFPLLVSKMSDPERDVLPVIL